MTKLTTKIKDRQTRRGPKPKHGVPMKPYQIRLPAEWAAVIQADFGSIAGGVRKIVEDYVKRM